MGLTRTSILRGMMAVVNCIEQIPERASYITHLPPKIALIVHVTHVPSLAFHHGQCLTSLPSRKPHFCTSATESLAMSND
jgi:hypothetical protein